MRCTGYEMARYKGTQASHLYEKSMHTLCTIQWATAPGRSLNYPRPKSITHLSTPRASPRNLLSRGDTTINDFCAAINVTCLFISPAYPWIWPFCHIAMWYARRWGRGPSASMPSHSPPRSTRIPSHKRENMTYIPRMINALFIGMPVMRVLNHSHNRGIAGGQQPTVICKESLTTVTRNKGYQVTDLM